MHLYLLNELTIASFLYEMRLQGVMVVVVIILDWKFLLMNKSATIPCSCISEKELVNTVTVEIIITLHSSSVHFSYVHVLGPGQTPFFT